MTAEVANNPAETWYPTPDDLGIDEGMRQRIAQTILDRSIDIPPSERGARENYGQWSTESMLQYGRWLGAVLDLDFENGDRLMDYMIDRASHLDIGPSDKVLYTNDEIKSYRGYHRLLGSVPRRPFEDMTKWELIEQARSLARVHGRLERPVLAALARKGLFVGEKFIRSRLGSMTLLHEYSGKPSPRGWTKDDFLDWGVAFFDQNPDAEINKSSISELSKRKVGPSMWSIADNFDGITDFREQVKQERAIRQQEEQERRDRRRLEIKHAVEQGIIPEALFAETSEDNHPRIYGLYIIAKECFGIKNEEELIRIASTQNPNMAARYIAGNSPEFTVCDVEESAERLDLFDDIWPMTRFQNVDLVLAA